MWIYIKKWQKVQPLKLFLVFCKSHSKGNADICEYISLRISKYTKAFTKGQMLPQYCCW